MSDEQQKLDSSFQLPATGDNAGKINFDDRGNAFFEWRDDLVGEDGDAAQRRRDKALENPGLSLVDDGLRADTDLAPRDCRSDYNPYELTPREHRSGYNPYESGVPDRKAMHKKRDLRELSQWIEARRKTESKE